MRQSLLLKASRSSAFIFGIFAALLFLISSSWRSGSSTSPRKIVYDGWKTVKDRVSVAKQVDGLSEFVKEPGCNFTSLDLHHPYSPRCTDRKSLLEAMSGGGRLGWDAPYWTRGCDMQWFTPTEICDILGRFDHIYLVGDSMMRHISQGLHVLMRANLVDGGRATWKDGKEEDPLDCHCHNVFNNPGCVWWSAINTVDLLSGDPDSIYCKTQPALVSWEAILNFPLNEEFLHSIFSNVHSKSEPNGRDVFILGHGLWNDLEAETSMSWFEQIEAAMEEEMPAYFAPDLDASLFPRLFITPSAQGEGKPDIFHHVQNNIRLMRHTHEVSAFAESHGYEHIEFYNMTVQSTSPDGTHATLENNLMKSMMVLNWLNMLDPTYRHHPPPVEDAAKDPKWKQKHRRPMQPLMKDPADAKLAASLIKEAESKSAAAAKSSILSDNEDVAKTKDVESEETAAPAPAKEAAVPAKETSAHVKQSDHKHSNAKQPGNKPPPKKPAEPTYSHPIDYLLAKADEQYQDLMKSQTSGVQEAAVAYREARGRHPPPKFDQWVKWCEERDVVMVEQFFDQIYDDLAPFWSIDPQVMRDFPRSWMNVLSIRNGTLTRWEDEPENIANWMEFWSSGLSALPVEDLPDVDLAFNGEDEPKLFVAWETIQQAMSKAEMERQSRPPPRTVINDYSTYAPLPTRRPDFLDRNGYRWADFPEDRPLWLAGREACAPTSPARDAPVERDYSRPPQFPDPRNLSHMHDGYVSDWAASKSSCANPELRSLHGTWIGMLSSSNDNARPNQKAIITELVPLLSGCKIHDVNAEILIPPAMQWPSKADASDFTFNFKEDKRIPWTDKADLAFWRGSASGGVNSAENWTRFQRHRFLALLNGTLVAEHARVAGSPLPAHVPGGSPSLPHNFPMPDPDVYPLGALAADDAPAALGDWIDGSTDAGFIHLRCFPPPSWFHGNGQDCAYNGGFYTVADIVPSSASFRYKYQPDLDGASYSGRYRSLLQSNSLPIKATIYDEWHDSRLVPWRHFVPMDNTFVDWLGIMEYFLGYEPGGGQTQLGEGDTQPSEVHASLSDAGVNGVDPASAIQRRDHTTTKRHASSGGEPRPSRDDTARQIGAQGSEWTRTVLRTDDMLAYMYRLILELARLSDDRRDAMGYAEDLTPAAAAAGLASNVVGGGAGPAPGRFGKRPGGV